MFKYRFGTVALRATLALMSVVTVAITMRANALPECGRTSTRPTTTFTEYCLYPAGSPDCQWNASGYKYNFKLFTVVYANGTTYQCAYGSINGSATSCCNLLTPTGVPPCPNNTCVRN